MAKNRSKQHRHDKTQNNTGNLLNQDHISKCVSVNTLQKMHHLTLNDGVYKSKYTRCGRYQLLFSNCGSLSLVDWKKLGCVFEIELGDSVFDSTFFHNEQYFATSQTDAIYIYNNMGTELHCLRKYRGTKKISFLDQYFLLAGCSMSKVFYQDVSLGKHVTTIETTDRLASIYSKDGLVYCGTSAGTINLYTPNDKESVAKILVGSGNIHWSKIYDNNLYCKSSSGQIKVYDTRHLFNPLFELKKAGDFVDVSENGMLAVSQNKRVSIFKNMRGAILDCKKMDYLATSRVTSIEFQPHEDILSVCGQKSFNSIIVPDSGCKHLYTEKYTPFLTRRQKSNIEISELIDKIPYQLISLANAVGVDGRQIKSDEIQTKEQIHNNTWDSNPVLKNFYR